MTDSSANPRNYGERPVHEDDPLMELSRIMDFGTPADDNAAWNERRQDSQFEDQGRAEPRFNSTHDDSAFDPVLDLERELMGDFDDYSRPVAFGEADPAEPHGGGRAYAEQPALQEEEFAAALEEEFGLGSEDAAPSPEIFEFEEADRSEPVPQFDYNDYSQARDSSESAYESVPLTDEVRNEQVAADAEEYDPSIYQPAIEAGEAAYHDEVHVQDSWSEQGDWNVQPVEAPVSHFSTEPVQQPVSLEHELENLLFGDEPRALTSQNAFSGNIEPASIEPEQSYPVGPESLVSEPLQDVQAHTGQDYVPSTSEAPAYPYYPRSNFAAGVAAPGVLSAVPQQPEPSAQVYDQSSEDDFSFEGDFNFTDDTETVDAAESTDDDLSGLDDISLTEDDFGFELSGDISGSDEKEDAEENLFNEEDFFTEDDLDLNGEEEEVASAPIYAHAVHSDEDYRPSASFSSYTDMQSVARTPAPEVETLTVAEDKVEQTHSLDLPEVNYGDEEAGSNLSELEAEFAEVFSTISVDEKAPISEGQSEADKAFEDIFRESASSYLPTGGMAAAGAAAGLGAATTAAGSYRRTAPEAGSAAATAGSQDDFYNHWAAQGAQTIEGGDYGERAVMQAEEDLGSAAEAYRNHPVRGRRGLILASIAGVAVLLGGIGYHFLIGGSSNEPVVIRADNQPIKVQPENPGGTTVPNQDKAVYDRVAGTLPNNPEQKTLITSGEDPVDISGTNDSETVADEPVANTLESQTAQANTDQNAPLIQPREVETMIVRPDGTIVQPSPVSEPVQQPVANDTPPAAPAGRDEIGALAAGNNPAAEPATTPAPQAPQPAAETPRLPVRAPIVPSRPAEQPVNIVGNVPQRTQAPAAPAAPQVASAAGAGGYFIQIASQPSVELAQKSYANMAQKYGSVIGGRGVDIKRADIPGKGTYYRVRVQAGSKEEATALCGRLKSAGGSCFVTQ